MSGEQSDLSVVIPTFNRRAVLAETLDALSEDAQVSDVRLDVVVVDDGSSDDTLNMLEQRTDDSFSLRILSQENRGPATARNRGVRAAQAPFVWFLGDDTRPRSGTTALHLQALHRGHTAVQGMIHWDPDRDITDLMRFLAPEGPQFYFRGLKDGETIPWSAVLGSNFSAPTQWLLDEPFDEGFPFAAVEDSEMAWRWYRRGRTAIFQEQAVCWHNHLYDDLAPFLKRQERAGISARYAVSLHPRLFWKLALEPYLVGLYKRLRNALASAKADSEIKVRNKEWERACRKAYLSGFRKGLSDPTV